MILDRGAAGDSQQNVQQNPEGGVYLQHCRYDTFDPEFKALENYFCPFYILVLFLLFSVYFSLCFHISCKAHRASSLILRIEINIKAHVCLPASVQGPVKAVV